MRGGEVDAINPTFGINLLPLKSDAGHHVQPGAGALPGAHRHPVRPEGPAAAACAVVPAGDHDGDRPPGDHQDGVRRRSRATRSRSTASSTTRPTRRTGRTSRKWNYNPAKALALLKKHCTGGPSSPSGSNSAIFTCCGPEGLGSLHVDGVERDAHDAGGDHQGAAQGDRHRRRRRRAAGERRLRPDRRPERELRPRELRVGRRSPDPAGFVPTWGCGGLSNYLNYCNRKATKLLDASQTELDPAKRAALFQQADALMSNDVP